MEKTICGDPDLSKADETLAQAYAAALKPLSLDAQSVTRAGQKSWLGYVTKVCHMDGTAFPADEASQPPSLCVENLYQNRIQELATASPHVGLYQFYTRFEFKAAPADPGDMIQYGENTSELTTYQIDHPASGDEQAWNTYMSHLVTKSIKADCDGSYTRGVTSRIDGAFPGVISVTLTAEDYCGRGPDDATEVVSTWSLQQGRTLQAGDVFAGPSSRWQPPLKQATLKALKSHYNRDDPNAAQPTMEQFSKGAGLKLKAGSWTIKAEGLGIQFQRYDIGESALGSPQIVIPWETLKPYLNPASPIKLPPG